MGRGVSKLRVAGVRVLLSTLLSESLQIFTDLESLIERLKACKGCVLTFFCHLYSLLSVCNLQIGKNTYISNGFLHGNAAKRVLVGSIHARKAMKSQT